MSQHNQFMIENHLSRPLILNIEPECAQFSLRAGDKVTVWDRFDKEPVTLRVEGQSGETIISVWPGDGEVRVEKDGVDLFSLIEKDRAVDRLASS
jgi:hypothetical protein